MDLDPRLQRSAGIAGVLAGIALLGEFTLFTISGFAPQTFNDAAHALPFLQERGAYLRAAAVFGAVGVALTALFLAGLAARLQARTPMGSAAVLCLGLLGNVGDGLVALSCWLGIPVFVALAARDQATAVGAWGAFIALTDGFGGLGNFLLGSSLLAAGWAILAGRALPAGLGWLALLAGVATVVRVFAANTLLDALVGAAFFFSLLGAIVFRLWAGLALWRKGAAGRSGPSTVPSDVEAAKGDA
jgi:hypothetical protein